MTRSRLTARCMPLVLIIALSGAAPMESPPAQQPALGVHGDYVEARTASVFAGACHYNGERVTEGRSAVMAWNIAGGSFGGVDLSNVRVVAAVSCDDNLAEASAARRSLFVVDADTDARAAAAVSWIRSRCDQELGAIAGVQRSAITFEHESEAFTVTSSDFAALSVHAMPDHACCTQPELVWYHPLMPVDGRRVGYTVSATVHAAAVALVWDRSDENSAFYGQFDH